ncbi:hypothetical protein ABI59_20035 [Acidobacteria bacterium Mor1]|nr:hypothetical protein ABI59_20035 [Acidobacteria bacterium Mor1]
MSGTIRRLYLAAATILVTLTVLAAPATAETLVLHPVQDNSLFEEAPTFSNGAGQHLFAGKILFGPRRRALLRFELPSPGVLPAGARITDMRLELHMSRTIAGDTPMTLHRLTQPWGEGASDAPGPEGTGTEAMPGDATWTHTFWDAATWDTPGGDFDVEPSAAAIVGGNGFYSFRSAGMLVDMGRTRAQNLRNFGWILLGDETVNTTAKRFDSREHPDPSLRPRLVIEYEVPERLRPIGAAARPIANSPVSGRTAAPNRRLLR